MATDNPVLEPASDIMYGSNNSDAESTTEEVTTETEEDVNQPVEEDVETTETEESDNADDEPSPEGDDQEESLYVDLDGEEVSFDDIKEWKNGHLRQADYSRKTDALAQERKSFEAEKSELSTKAESLQQLTAQLEAEIGAEDEVNLDELREDDPEEYIKLTERNAKREKLLSKAKELSKPDNKISDADVAAEQKLMIESNPHWIDKEGKATKAYKDEMKSLDTYFSTNGWSQDEISGIYQSKHMGALIKAAKYDALQGKKKAIVKEVRKAPVIKKGKANTSNTASRSAADIMYSK